MLESYDDDNDKTLSEFVGNNLCNGVPSTVHCASSDSKLIINNNKSLANSVNENEVQQLLQRKDELEKQHRSMENNKQKLQVSLICYIYFIFVSKRCC